ncbi:hypothetical protein [Enterobacter quasiroggenkampii]|uniref:hypothetical protein n=1 Tax=Enterobacter quasiroggenkampii TaxID=2497436 RepID=UPI0039C4C761
MKWIHNGNGEVTTEEYEADDQKVVDLICNCEVVNGVSVNAQLIAAAPDLLAALRLIISYHDDGNCELHSEDVSMARAAISKALGEE